MKKFLSIRLNAWFIIIVAMIVIATTKNVYMINTGDFHRAIFPFMPPIPSFQHNMDLKYHLYDEFWGISKFTYMSTYSYILYFTGEVFKLLTDQLDARILSAIIKTIYIAILFSLYVKLQSDRISYLDYAVALLLIIFLCSSSNIAFFPSFYQEQVVLVFLPIMAMCLVRRENTLLTTTLFVVSAFIIGGSKSQFFYMPLLSMIFVFHFIKYRKLALLALLIAQIACVFFVMNSSDATNFNKYHSAYYGVYAYEKMNGIELPDGVDEKCIGIDAWGGQLDKEKGSHRSTLGKSCYENNKNVSFIDSVREYIKHPSIIFMLPFDDVVKDNLVTDYIHVAKTIKVIVDDKVTWSTQLTHLKDRFFGNLRMFIMVLILTAFIVCKKTRSISMPLAIVTIFGISQFYISFIGEGYRDLSKHLFGLSFSFDMVVFLSISSLIYILKRKPQ
ncbi:hypothetical protein K6636_22790 [Escherichia coli]|uniref:hypothetical protein n=1 Tax=Escherichia coli TaxID=562 RepID=UPI0007519AC1|nr:hypothetical protein [Escherichia coli]EEV7373638.1 hypothetical protein [Escherichia coli]EFH6714235.1 hypothetical protein [Escherichia coli]EFO4449812.1 hypothetical protein [Escherichia coli]EGL8736309.1 hypothetical protein [Escherichia coli]EIF8669053.1 hypothetical protein [Escherichia coli]